MLLIWDCEKPHQECPHRGGINFHSFAGIEDWPIPRMQIRDGAEHDQSIIRNPSANKPPDEGQDPDQHEFGVKDNFPIHCA
ncbi:hypothetical protein GCM10027157_10770 [Corynebacterium aquatimens]